MASRKVPSSPPPISAEQRLEGQVDPVSQLPPGSPAKHSQFPAVPSEVFLSHSHHDKRLTVRVAEELRRHGVPAWYSERHIAGAQQWIDQIGLALKRCDWFVVVLTPEAVESMWVKRELAAALIDREYNGRIVPLLAKSCHYERLAWPLTTLQAISLRPFAKGIAELLRIWGIGYRS